MNLLLLKPSDLNAAGKASIYRADRRFKHLSTVLNAVQGSQLKVGLLNDRIGNAEISFSSAEKFDLDFELSLAPPPPLPVTLIIALPRPKAVLRLLQNVTTLGVKSIYLINALKVEKAFWSCEQLRPHSVEKSLLLGLEQARDTVLPTVYLKRRFKPFVEDELGTLSEGTQRIVAHPDPDSAVLPIASGSRTIVIGPEGGFIPYEVQMLLELGFQQVSLGARILKSEVAALAALSRSLP